MNDYHITRPDGTQDGPFSEEELKQLYQKRELPQGSLAWMPGWDTWKDCADEFSWYVLPPSLPKRATLPPLPVAFENATDKTTLSFLQKAWLYVVLGFCAIVLIGILSQISSSWPRVICKMLAWGCLAVLFYAFSKSKGYFRQHHSSIKENKKSDAIQTHKD